MSSANYPQSNGRAEAAVKTAKRIISNYVSREEPYSNQAIAHAIIQHRNTPLHDLKLSPAQLLLHRHLRDKIPTHPQHLRLHKEWILTAKQREFLFRTKNLAMLERYNTVSKPLTPLQPRTKVLIISGNKNPRWNLSGIVVMKLPFRKYKIKLDGSGRIVTRNRCFLREYKHTRTPVTDSSEYSPIITPTNTSDVGSDIVPKNLQPFNKPGLMESDHQRDYRATRSGARY